VIAPAGFAQTPAKKPPVFSSDRVLVSFHPGTAASDIRAAHSQVGGKVVKTIGGMGVHVIAVPSGTVRSAIQRYQRNPNVRYAEPNYLRPLVIPSEGSFTTGPVFDEQWNLHNHGQGLKAFVDGNTGLPGWTYTRRDADIDAIEAWDIEKGSPDIWVAVPDSGVACDHGDLVGKCRHNEDFVSAEFDSFGTPIPELVDQLGHGTHVAGTIGMQTNNGDGGSGVGWHTSIGSFKVCYAEIFVGIVVGSSCQDADIVAAIDRIIELGYHVINMSFAGPASQAIEDAMNRASQAGILLVAGAGNNNNWEKFFPAAYDNVIAVGATNAFDDRAGFSTFSVDDDFDASTQNDDWVDVMAPGDPILGPVPANFCSPPSSQCFGFKSGTSMATPHVSGVAALVWNYLLVNDPANANSTEVRRRIQDCADQTGAMGQDMLVWSKYGRLNAYNALTCGGGGGGGGGGGDTTAPVISSVSSTKTKGTRFEITWTTDEAATTNITITGSGNFDDTTMVTSHSREFRGSKGVTYEYFVSSTDAAGNTAGPDGPYYHTVQ
jgi:thermitase